MIRLMVEDYCQECPDFVAESNVTALNIGGTTIAGNTIVRCENQERCERMYKQIKKSMKS